MILFYTSTEPGLCSLKRPCIVDWPTSISHLDVSKMDCLGLIRVTDIIVYIHQTVAAIQGLC